MNCLKDPSENKYPISGPLFTSCNVLSCSRSPPVRDIRSYVNSIRGKAVTQNRPQQKSSKTLTLRPLRALCLCFIETSEAITLDHANTFTWKWTKISSFNSSLKYPYTKERYFWQTSHKVQLNAFPARHLNGEKLIWPTKLRNSGQWSKASLSSRELRKGIRNEEMSFRKMCEESRTFFFTFDVGRCHLNERSCLVETQQKKHANNESNTCNTWFYNLITRSVFRMSVTCASFQPLSENWTPT